ncbi:unnamed protein product [Lymnaea stagnalis]|uniref:[heparan sulfate]-glucosamine N-sulfotransferase n=1 Tax=Lymnaea stagnalis TaxID=6523 RepID=A0AAV2HUN9_LYMST
MLSMTRVTIRQVAVWVLTLLGRVCSMKRCSLFKIVTILFSMGLTWVTLLLINASGVALGIRSKMNSDLMAARAARDVGDLAANEQPLVDDYLVQDNPLGFYFNEKLHGNIPIGAPFQAAPKLDHQIPLKKVLVFVGDLGSPQVIVLGQFFAHQRIEYRTTLVTGDVPTLVLSDLNVPRYVLLVFDDYASYLRLDARRRSLLDDYCKKYKVGILALTQSKRSSETEVSVEFKLKLQHGLKLKKFKLNTEVDFWRVAKRDMVWLEDLPSSDWTIFSVKHSTYRPVAFSTVDPTWRGSGTNVSKQEFGCVVALHDRGLLDGVERVILGLDLSFWLNAIIAMDAMTYLTNGRLGLPLDRLLQIDIDDMFVGHTGIRTHARDAEEMVASQNRIRHYIPNFSYFLGFSGGWFLAGTPLEQSGDRRLVELAEHFQWFNHMYRHEQPHTQNGSIFKLSLDNNTIFAEKHKIRVVKDYMVTPHHSGVYPALEMVYDEWIKRGVVCSSTEEYPSITPQWGRRGFIHRGIMVVPRQTCRLYTKTVNFEDYPGGKEQLDYSIRGGFLFNLFLSTPVMIFMTHMSNYANDRLAMYAFEKVIEFVLTWTNLRLLSPPPAEIARRYFSMYPQEINPVWTNPCDSEKHREIWPEEKSCRRLPKLIIVGPQKTGTTALLRFLEAHPSLKSSKQDPVYFEEIQFFIGKNYLNGLEWYQEHFPEPNDPRTILFEKSANYFDNELAPKRIYALLPRAKIVIIVSEPARRAYSWYHHMRSHDDPVVMNYTFFEVVSAPETAPRFLRDARNRCLKPGMYAVHLARWLQFFPQQQILLIDGDQLSKDPITVLNNLQIFAGVQPFIDYSGKLEYQEEKGFYCLTETGCLSSNKGRKYPPMDVESSRYLDKFFKDHNTNLRTLLSDINYPYPLWLAQT